MDRINWSDKVVLVSVWDYFCQRATGCVTVGVKMQDNELSFLLPADSYTVICIEERGKAALSLFPGETPPSVVERFAFSHGQDVDKFAAVPYRMERALPLPEVCPSYLLCRIIEQKRQGDKILFYSSVSDMGTGEGVPLDYPQYLKQGGKPLPFFEHS